MDNQQPSLEQRKVQRLSALQVIGRDCGGHPIQRVEI
nr:MAG TPA: hypothetical protein [Caudoviricetes sp.]